MLITSSTFVKSSKTLKECPEQFLPEFTFMGRSNVGKSSFINMLANKRTLAKPSVTPGKTRMINHYLINGEFYMVDLPGLGYAEISVHEKRKWEIMIYDFLLNRACLLHTFLLIDSRLEPQQIDLEIMAFLNNHKLPFTLIFTKTDKLKTRKLLTNIAAYKKSLHTRWKRIPPSFLVSAKTKSGREKILYYIKKIMDDYFKDK